MGVRILVIQGSDQIQRWLWRYIQRRSRGTLEKVEFHAPGAFGDGEIALEAALAATGEPLVIVCSEVFHGLHLMGCGSGSELALAIKAKRPDAYVVLYTSAPPLRKPDGVDVMVTKDRPSNTLALLDWLICLTSSDKVIPLFLSV